MKGVAEMGFASESEEEICRRIFWPYEVAFQTDTAFELVHHQN